MCFLFFNEIKSLFCSLQPYFKYHAVKAESEAQSGGENEGMLNYLKEYGRVFKMVSDLLKCSLSFVLIFFLLVNLNLLTKVLVLMRQ